MGIMRLADQSREWSTPYDNYSKCRSSDVYQMSRIEGLYERYADAVFRYCLRQVGRRDLAEDLASEVFLTLHQKLGEVQDDQLPAWLFTVAKNKAVDYWRHQAVAIRYEKTHAEEPVDPGPGVSFETMLQQNKSLRPVHRTCLILRYVHDLSRSEISQVTGLSETQIKGHLQYALKLLRQSFIAAESGE
jgi:RNA polymerase sigma-70 factor, ECF subfamily